MAREKKVSRGDPGRGASRREPGPEGSREEALAEKLRGLEALLAPCRRVAVAFSGGVDSTFLLAALCRDPDRKVLAVTAASPTHPLQEQGEAREAARRLGVRHLEVPTDEYRLDAFRKNPPDRCYHCKRHLFSRMDEIRVREGCEVLVDGTNADDAADFRPGMRALRELGVRSPLLEAGFTKADVREISRRWGLSTWDKPSVACLASRFPYGTEITPEGLGRVDRCESFLRERVRGPVRVRSHGAVARIEASPDAFPALLRDRGEIAAHFREQGFSYVTLDLDGYRSGSLNEVLPERE